MRPVIETDRGSLRGSWNVFIFLPRGIRLLLIGYRVRSFLHYPIIDDHYSVSRFSGHFFFRLGSLQCIHKLSIRSVITACKRNILFHSDQFRIVVPLNDYFRRVFNDCYQQKHVLIAVKSTCHKFSPLPNFPKKSLIIQSINTVMNIKSAQNSQKNIIHSFIEFPIFHAILQ